MFMGRPTFFPNLSHQPALLGPVHKLKFKNIDVASFLTFALKYKED